MSPKRTVLAKSRPNVHSFSLRQASARHPADIFYVESKKKITAGRGKRQSLLGQVLTVNALLVAAVIFVATVAANLNLADERWQFAALAMAIMLILVGVFALLKRQFAPLQELMDTVEKLDFSDSKRKIGLDRSRFVEPETAAEVERLTESFNKMLKRIDSERKRAGQQVLHAQEEERKRIARDLHDQVNQALTAILLRLEAAIQEGEPKLREELLEAKRLVNRAMDELLTLARQLRPSLLDEHGLVPALADTIRELGESTDISAHFSASGSMDGLSDSLQLVAYRIVQEALTNVARHSEASNVSVELRSTGNTVELTVRDDGRGFDLSTESQSPGLGISGMRERARLVEGTLEIESSPGQGTTIKVRAPISTSDNLADRVTPTV